MIIQSKCIAREPVEIPASVKNTSMNTFLQNKLLFGLVGVISSIHATNFHEWGMLEDPKIAYWSKLLQNSA